MPRQQLRRGAAQVVRAARRPRGTHRRGSSARAPRSARQRRRGRAGAESPPAPGTARPARTARPSCGREPSTCACRPTLPSSSMCRKSGSSSCSNSTAPRGSSWVKLGRSSSAIAAAPAAWKKGELSAQEIVRGRRAAWESSRDGAAGCGPAITVALIWIKPRSDRRHRILVASRLPGEFAGDPTAHGLIPIKPLPRRAAAKLRPPRRKMEQGMSQSSTATGSRRAIARLVAVHHRLHRVLRGLDDLLDHRHPDQEGPRAERHAVRPAGRHADPDRHPDPPDARHLGGPVRRPRRLHADHAVGGGGDLPADLRLRLPDLPARRARRRHRRRLLLGRHRLCLEVVPEGEAGHRARHLRRRQCRRGRHQVRSRRSSWWPIGWKTVAHRLGGGAGGDRGRSSCSSRRTTRTSRAAAPPAQKPEPLSAHDGAAEEHPGLALRALLLLRLRRLRRAGAVAAALPDRRLRPRHHHRRHDRRGLLDPGLDLPRLWRRTCPTSTARGAIMYWTFVVSVVVHASSCPTRRPTTSCRASAGPIDFRLAIGPRRLHRRWPSCSASS